MESNNIGYAVKLVILNLHGYRRFSQPTKLHLDNKVISIVGPNESGKSSILEALLHLNDNMKFIRKGNNQEISRQGEYSDDHLILSALYCIEENDLQEVAHIDGYRRLRWLEFKKYHNDTVAWEVIPKLKRSLMPRVKIIKELSSFLSKPIFLDILENAELNENYIQNIIDQLHDENETLPKGVLTSLNNLYKTLSKNEPVNSPKYFSQFLNNLKNLLDHENSETPAELATKILSELRPIFLDYSEDSRSLPSEYVLKSDEEPSQSLLNLAKLAELDLDDLTKAVTNDDQGRITTIITRSNDNLKRIFDEYWSQQQLSVHFRVSGNVLHLLIKRQGNLFTSIAESSDGLKQFIALVSFTSTHTADQKPVLLIDEIETHLHYDAQSDIVQMLSKQPVVEKVIYTTHSFGCLPEDTGSGIRAIEPIGNSSRIINWFWEDHDPGIKSLLFRIGASTVAFLTIRFSLFTEGASDTVLLPYIFREIAREIAGKEYLGFQIIPGISEIKDFHIAIVDKQAPRTAYIVDSDGGGQKLKRKLIRSGINEEKIFSLPQINRNGTAIEDFIDPKLYCQAVNNELSRSHNSPPQIPKSGLSITKRAKSVDRWCKANNVESPKRTSVAYRITEKVDGSIIQSSRRRLIKQLYSRIEEYFKEIDETST